MNIEHWQRDPSSLYRLAVAQATDYVIFLLDAEARIVTWTPAVRTLFGWAEPEFVGRTFGSLFPSPGVAHGLADHVLAEAAERRQARYTEQHLRSDGTQFWGHGRVASIVEGEELCGYVVSLQDVTAPKSAEDRHRAEVETLRRRVSEFETLLQVVPIGIGIAEDAACSTIRINEAFSRMLRMPADGNASLSAAEGVRPTHFRVFKDGRELLADELPLQVAARTGEQVSAIELDVVFDSGDRVRLLEYASPLLDHRGVSRGSVGAFVDVTERAAAEAHFRRLANSAAVLIWTAGPDHTRNWFNTPWLNFTGDTLAHQAGGGWTERIHAEDRDRCLASYHEAFEARRDFRLEYRLRRHDGQYRWLLDIGTPSFGTHGELTGYIGSCVDMTERKEYEQQRERLLEAEREARHEAERINTIKDEFLANLSHEIRTPLNAILGWSQMLRDVPELPERVRRGLEVVDRNARLQTRLLEDLLDMSRILSGKIRLELEPLRLASLVERAVEAILPSAQAKSLNVVATLEPPVGLVMGDAVRLQQVLWNLLSNAIKFTPAGGEVRVTLAPLNGDVELKVTDTGAGILPDFLPHVFDRFRQADGSTTRTVGGLGLGLSIVKYLVELHGGAVRASSDGEGQGATFTVLLPIAPRGRDEEHAAPGPPLTSAASGPSLAGLTVLVVEDHDDSRTLLTTMLEHGGAAVVAVDATPAALAAVINARPDVIVSDIGLPGEDGYSLMRQVRAIDADGPEIPALALTAYARAEDRRLALVAGFHMHMPKPVDAEELCTAVASLAGRL